MAPESETGRPDISYLMLGSPPPLRTIFERNEGRLIYKCEHYFDVYERHFSTFRGRSPRILEIGVFHGGSLDMWGSYFGRGTHLVGIDIDQRCADLARRNIHIRNGDQSDRDFLRRVVAEDGPFDVIIEDGSHLPEHQIIAFEELWSAVKPGGVMLVEDLCTNYWPEYGGERGADGMFMEYIKPLVDDLNALNSRSDDFTPTDFTPTCTGMHVYDSMVVFDLGTHEPLATRLSGRPVFDATPLITDEHWTKIAEMNRPVRRARRILRSPIQSADTVLQRARRRIGR